MIKADRKNNIRILSHIITGVLSLSLLLPVFREAAYAAENGDHGSMNVIKNADYTLLTGQLDTVIDDFNHATVKWTLESNQAAAADNAELKLEAVTGLDFAPYKPFEGSRCLLASCSGYPSNTAYTVKYDFGSRKNFSAARYFSLTICTDGKFNELFDVTLSVISDKGAYSFTETISGGSWHTLFFDVSDTIYTASARYLTFSITRSDSNEGDFSFAVDCAGISNKTDAVFTMHYLAPDYFIQGGTLDKTGNMTLQLNGINPYIQTPMLGNTDFSGGKAIRMRLKNLSGCKSVTLYYTTLTSSDFTDKNCVTADIGSGSEDIQSCIFPVPENYIGQIRIVFNGSVTGKAEIYSIDTVSYYTEAASAGEITECRIAQNGSEISIKGKVSSENLTKYKDSALYLYAIEPYESVSDISLSRTAAAETALNAEYFSFTVGIGQNNNLLFKKFVVMIYYGGSLTAVDDPVFVTNAGNYSGSAVSRPDIGIKGCYPLTGEYSLDGIKQTAVEVELEKLISLDKLQYSYIYEGKVYYFNTDYINYLDDFSLDCMYSGTYITMMLTVSSGADDAVNRILLHPSADANATYSAFNTVTDDGIRYLRAACDFLASRYSLGNGSYGMVTGFTVGKKVGDTRNNYSMGETTLAEFAGVYSNAVRIVYNAVKLRSFGTSVYVSLGCGWYSDISVNESLVFDSRSALDVIAATIKDGGDIGWKLAYDPYPDYDIYFAYSDGAAQSFEAGQITAANLEQLIGYMSQSRLEYKGSARGILLLEQSIKKHEDSNDLIMLAADYAYTYLKLISGDFSLVEGFIIGHDVSYNGTLKYIDTNHYSTVTGYALELMDISSFSEIIPSFDSENTGFRTVNETNVLKVVPSSVTGEAYLWEFEDSADGWSADKYCASLTPGTSLGELDGLLAVKLSEAGSGKYCGIRNVFNYTLDLSVAPYIGFDVQLAVLPSGVNQAEITVAFYSGDSFLTAVGTLEAGKWNTVIVSLLDFDGIRACDKMTIWVRGIDGADIGEPTLLIGSIRAMSTDYSNDYIEQVIADAKTETPKKDPVNSRLVWALVLVIVLAVTAEILNIMVRVRQNIKLTKEHTRFRY